MVLLLGVVVFFGFVVDTINSIAVLFVRFWLWFCAVVLDGALYLLGFSCDWFFAWYFFLLSCVLVVCMVRCLLLLNWVLVLFFCVLFIVGTGMSGYCFFCMV